MLGRTVGVKEFTADINYRFAVPIHNKIGIFFNNGNNGCFKVFAVSDFAESLGVLCLNNNCHSLLTFGDCKLRSVKTLVFFGNGVEVDFKSVGKLADCNRNTACAEVVAAFDKQRSLFISEKALKLSFFGCITLLNLSSAVFKGFKVMRF